MHESRSVEVFMFSYEQVWIPRISTPTHVFVFTNYLQMATFSSSETTVRAGLPPTMSTSPTFTVSP